MRRGWLEEVGVDGLDPGYECECNATLVYPQLAENYMFEPGIQNEA
jgi:hypothetical protein